MHITANTVVDGRYEILAALGEGGMSVVYKANQLQLDRVVALKVLHDGVSEESEERARLQREAMALNALHHTGIVGVYGFGMWSGFPYVVMEYVDGVSLQSLLQANGALPPAKVIDIMLQLCSALSKAHANAIVHRDLKPSNIMLMPGAAPSTDVVKIIDFGLARLLPGFGKDMQRLTEAGNALGSILYMSPEQCVADEVDHRSDIYSLGIILYQCLTGTSPYAASDNTVAVMHAHVNLPIKPIPPSMQLPAGLQGVIYRALAKKRDERYQSTDEMAADLRKVSSGAGQALDAAYPAPPRSTEIQDPKKARGLLSHRAVVSLLVALLLAGVVALFVLQNHNEDRKELARSSVELYQMGSTMHSDTLDERAQRLKVLEQALVQHNQDHMLEPSMVLNAEYILATLYEAPEAVPLLMKAMSLPQFPLISINERCKFYRTTAVQVANLYTRGPSVVLALYESKERKFVLDKIEREFSRTDDDFVKAQLLVDMMMLEPDETKLYDLFKRLKSLKIAGELSLFPAVDVLRAYRRCKDFEKRPERIADMFAFAENCSRNQGRISVDMYETLAQTALELQRFSRCLHYARLCIANPIAVNPNNDRAHVAAYSALKLMPDRDTKSNVEADVLLAGLRDYCSKPVSQHARDNIARALHQTAQALILRGRKAEAEKIYSAFPAARTSAEPPKSVH